MIKELSIGAVIGAIVLTLTIAIASLGSYVNEPLPPIDAVPCPPNVLPVDRDLVVGLAETVVDLNRQLQDEKDEAKAFEAQADRVFRSLLKEIDRLKKRPTIKPGDKSC